MKTWLHKTPFWLKWLYPDIIWNMKRSGKSIYLTFDDGPTADLTDWIMNVLDSYDFKATFFCVGENFTKFPHKINEMRTGGHRLGNHTFNHKNGWQTGFKDYIQNVEMCENFFEDKERVKLFRPPYGKITRRQKTALLNKGYTIIMWDVLSGDFDQNLSPDKCLKALKKYTRPGSVIVFHDNLKSEKLLRIVLPAYFDFLKRKGFQTALWN